MKAQTLAISVPNYGCNKNCPYCVSKMTGYLKSNESLFLDNTQEGLTLGFGLRQI